MNEERYKKLGSEKQKDMNTSFDSIHEKYRLKALEDGYTGELKFVKERGRVVIFVEIV